VDLSETSVNLCVIINYYTEKHRGNTEKHGDKFNLKMKRINILSTAFLMVVLMSSSGYMQAQCDHADDLRTMPVKSGGFAAGTEQNTSTDDGWIITKGIRVQGGGGSGTTPSAFKAIEEGKTGVLINGNILYAGSLQSPVFPGGCSAISFKCARNGNPTTSRFINIDIVPVNGETWTHLFEKEMPARQVMYADTIKGIDVKGDFYILFTNLHPNNSSAQYVYDDILIWDICITSNIPPVLPPTSLVATPKSTGIALKWNSSASEDVEGYVIWQNGDSIATVADTVYTAVGLAPETEYTFKVVAFNADGVRSDTAEVTASTLPLSTDAAIHELTVNGAAWNIGDKFLIPCGGGNNLSIKIAAEENAKILHEGTEAPDGEIPITVAAPSIRRINFEIVAEDGVTRQAYTLAVEKRFDFNALVVARWDNTLIVNNNPATNGEYSFTAFKWYRNGAEIGTGQYYSAGARKSDLLDANAEYSVAATTVGGDTLRTCPARITATRSTEIVAYPNPVSHGETVHIDIASGETDSTLIEVYTLTGQRLAVKKAEGRITPVAFPYPAGIYLVKVVTGDTVKDFKIIVR
jgi:hypothetical protein